MTKFHFSNGINAAHYTVEIIDNSVTFHSGASVKFHGDVADIGRLIRAILVATAPDVNVERPAVATESGSSPSPAPEQKSMPEVDEQKIVFLSEKIAEVFEVIADEKVSVLELVRALNRPDVRDSCLSAVSVMREGFSSTGISPIEFMCVAAKEFGL